MITKELLTTWKNNFVSLLFPVKCVICQQETENSRKNKLICTDCLKKLAPSFDLHCILCEAKNADGKICYSCTALGYKSHLDRLIYPFSYSDKSVQKVIKAFKYHFIKDLEKPIGRLLTLYLNKVLDQSKLKDLILTPVPLHKLKYNQRGYNQSELLVRQINHHSGKSILTNVLVKTRPTKDQASLKDNQRLKNIEGVFKCAEPEKVLNKKILLIDDVYTTGATMQECARVLKEVGAAEVIGLVIARG